MTTLATPFLNRRNATSMPPPPAVIRRAIVDGPVFLNAGAYSIGYAIAEITPDIANEITGANYRKRRDHRISFYAKQMAGSLWKLTPQSITFYANDERADGDHRLCAVRNSGTTQRFVVTWGWPTDIASVLDVGLPRQPIDFLKMVLSVPISNCEVGAVRILANAELILGGKHAVPNEILAEWCLILEDSMTFVREKMAAVKTKSGIFRSDVVAPLMANYYRTDRVKLARFIELLAAGSGYENNHEQNALLLRNDLLEQFRGKGDIETRRRVIGKTDNALRNFVKGTQPHQRTRATWWEDALVLPPSIKEQLTAAAADFRSGKQDVD